MRYLHIIFQNEFSFFVLLLIRLAYLLYFLCPTENCVFFSLMSLNKCDTVCNASYKCPVSCSEYSVPKTMIQEAAKYIVFPRSYFSVGVINLYNVSRESLKTLSDHSHCFREALGYIILLLFRAYTL